MRGFTLLEILVSVLIFGLLMAGIYGVLNVGSAIYREDINLVGLQQQGRQAMAAMVKEIRESKPSEVTITNGNTISFKVPPAIYADPWVGPISCYRDINDDNSDGITDQVIREYPAGTWKILGNDITALSFSITADIVEIGFAWEKTIGARQICFPAPCQEPLKAIKETVKLRNE